MVATSLGCQGLVIVARRVGMETGEGMVGLWVRVWVSCDAGEA